MTTTPPSTTLRGALFALSAFAIYASHDVVVKYLGASYTAFQIVFFSVLFGFPLVTFLLIRDAQAGTLRPTYPGWAAARTAASVVTAACAFYAFGTLPLAQVYAILFASPLVITVLAIPMLGERVGLHRGASVFAGLIGVLIVLRPGSAPLELGHIAALVAAFSSAFASLIMRKVGREERSVVMLLYPMVANFLVMGAALPFVYVPMPFQDIAASALIALLALIATACILAAYRNAPAIIVAPMQYSQIIWASLFGALLFGEVLDRTTVIGTAIIVVSGLYIVLREHRIAGGSNRPVLRTRTRPGVPTAPRIASLLSRSRK